MTAPTGDRVDKLRLIRTPGVGPIAYRQLIARFGTARAAMAAIPDLAARGGGRARPVPSAADVGAEIAAVDRLGAAHLFIDDPAYPALLAELDAAPPVVTWRGDLGLLARPAVAIVGARNASAAACRFARGLAHALAGEGHVVVSGLARGIDTAAHDGAMPATIGVIASGIDLAYPPENAALQERVARDALLIAEHPPGTQPLARHFPFRNRIIAGLAAGTVVVEAAPKSGSLLTARLAGTAGREVMAVPGSPLDPRAQGCNLLIRDGATLVQDAADVLEALRPLHAGVRAPGHGYRVPPPPADADDAARAEVRRLLAPTPVAVDEIVRQSALPPAVVATVLLELELAGVIARHAGARVGLA